MAKIELTDKHEISGYVSMLWQNVDLQIAQRIQHAARSSRSMTGGSPWKVCVGASKSPQRAGKEDYGTVK